MPLDKNIGTVLVVGSGPIVIGQAAEFDYAGTQACKALQEEGIKVVLVNSNPATIMTDMSIADTVYLEPLNVSSLERIIQKERPDGLLATLGGQTGLNLAVELSEAGVLDKYALRLLGTPLQAIKQAEDRELFKQLLEEIGEPMAESVIVSTMGEALESSGRMGFPIIVRPAYTMGGLGGGIASNEDELIQIVTRGFKNSRIGQLLLEHSVAGWKEIEYEVMRDANDTCITVCNMENIDPVGIHTGDSMVVAPSQTLSDKEYQMLRTSSLKIIRALKIEGGCNVQFALDPASFRYIIIEVNPRVSRSSALASKATGYPIAKVSAKIALGLHLDEIENSVTKKTLACFEPALDYIVTKIPRWPFDKFTQADRTLGTQMKATGEVMAMDRTMEGSFLKAVSSLEIGANGPWLKDVAKMKTARLNEYLVLADDRRLFVIFELMRRDVTLKQIHARTKIDRFFLKKFAKIISLEKEAREKLSGELLLSAGEDLKTARPLLTRLKRRGFTDGYLAGLLGVEHLTFREFRKKCGVLPGYKMVDTCGAEFEAQTPYYYSVYEEEDEVPVTRNKRKVIVLGSGPIRIGQGIEFDYCCVHAVWGLKEQGFEAVIINNNPETVSTDFDTADKLYFEPLTAEAVLNVIDKEQPQGVIVQFGGQTAINLTRELSQAGVKILGSDLASIDSAEDRGQFSDLLISLGIPQAEGKMVSSFEEALGVAHKLGYPLLVRPSYVIGGQAMEIVYNEEQLFQYIRLATDVSPHHPLLVDKYLVGKEVEVDAICDGEGVFMPGIFEHLERSGVHSGDSMAAFPPLTLTQKQIAVIVCHTVKIGKALKLTGLMNVQYVIFRDKVYCIEVNPRASRTVPILSKITGLELANLAAKVIMGSSLEELGLLSGLLEPPGYFSVKVPVFSFDKLKMVETSLGPEMKSTGEVLGLGQSPQAALFNAVSASGFSLPQPGNLLLSLAQKDKQEALSLSRRLSKLGFTLYGTKETVTFLEENAVSIQLAPSPGEGIPHVFDLIKAGKFVCVVNTATKGKSPEKLGFRIRRLAVELKTPCITALDTAYSIVSVLEKQQGKEPPLYSLNEYIRRFMNTPQLLPEGHPFNEPESPGAK